jgi:hypothetical protein
MARTGTGVFILPGCGCHYDSAATPPHGQTPRRGRWRYVENAKVPTPTCELSQNQRQAHGDVLVGLPHCLHASLKAFAESHRFVVVHRHPAFFFSPFVEHGLRVCAQVLQMRSLASRRRSACRYDISMKSGLCDFLGVSVVRARSIMSNRYTYCCCAYTGPATKQHVHHCSSGFRPLFTRLCEPLAGPEGRGGVQ